MSKLERRENSDRQIIMQQLKNGMKVAYGHLQANSCLLQITAQVCRKVSSALSATIREK